MHGEVQMEFSVVIPVKDEVDLIQRTLWSYYAVEPSEVLICTDKPCAKNVRKVVNKIAELSYMKDITRIIEVERSSEWRFHQVHVRRAGFHEAKFDRILTGDIDLVINKNVHKALELVGKNDVGLASLTKFRYPHRLTDYWQLGVVVFLRNFVHGMLDSVMATTTFSGLYALWRPYWLDSESEEAVKKLVNPKQFYRGERPDLKQVSAVTGEDTFLRDQMIKKHRCIYLKDIGGIDMGVPTESLPYIQYMKGQYFARQGRSLMVSLGRALLRGQPHYLQGYLKAKYED